MKSLVHRCTWLAAISTSVLVIVGSTGCQNSKPSVVTNAEQSPEDRVMQELLTKEWARRMPLFEDWLRAAAEVADASGDEEAKRTFFYMAKGGAVAAPVPEGLMLLQSPTESLDPPFIIVPLIQEDESMHPEWVHHPHALALYLPETRSIMLRTNVATTQIWKGIIFLHESAHALAFGTAPYDYEDMKTFCEKERDVHTFQNRLVEKIGGDRYQRVVQQEIAIQKDRASKEGTVAGFMIYHRTQKKYPMLDDIFGEALSEIEEDFRGTQVWIHAAFLLIDESYPPEERENGKALFLKSVYVEKGMFNRSTGRLAK